MYIVRKIGRVMPHESPHAAAKQSTDCDLNRLRQRYLKSPETVPKPGETESLQKIYEEILRRYTDGIAVDISLPRSMQSAFRSDLSGWDRTAAQGLAEFAERFSGESEDYKDDLKEFYDELLRHTKRLDNIVRRSSQEFRGYLALTEDRRSERFLFLGEKTEATCDICSVRHGTLLTAEELEQPNTIPPLHPNCRCRLVALDSAAVLLYNTDKAGFIDAVDAALDRLDSSGSLFRLENGLSMFSPSGPALTALETSKNGAVTEAGQYSTAIAWLKMHWEETLNWGKQFLSDAVQALDAYLESGADYVNDAALMLEENLIIGTIQMLDALLGAPLMRLQDAGKQRLGVAQDEGGFFNWLNYLTIGIPGMVRGALNPEEFLSFEHVMNFTGLVFLIRGAANAVRSRRTGLGGLTDAEKPHVSVLESTARRNGDVIKITVADDLNAAYLAKNAGHQPPYTPGTTVYQIRLTQNTRFVRVYGGSSRQSGWWIMNADDIAGLTPQQIQSKFSLPQLPTKICDVNVPAGTLLEVSSANGIMGGAGGGLQYQFIEMYLDPWFINERLLP